MEGNEMKSVAKVSKRSIAVGNATTAKFGEYLFVDFVLIF
jgi:hypothetical protein